MLRKTLVTLLGILAGLALILTAVNGAAAQDAEPEPTHDDRPATVRICVGLPPSDNGETQLDLDDVVSFDVQPRDSNSRIDATPEGDCGLLDNVPAGTYTFTIETASGVSITDNITVAAGDSGTNTIQLEEPGLGALPTTGYASESGSQRLPLALYLLGIAAIASGALVYLTARRNVG